jgi:hypothetical protein
MGMRGGEWGEGSCWKAGSKGVAEVGKIVEKTQVMIIKPKAYVAGAVVAETLSRLQA